MASNISATKVGRFTTSLTSNCAAAAAAPPVRARARKSNRNKEPSMRKTGKRRSGGVRPSKAGPRRLPAAGAGSAAKPLATRGRRRSSRM
jgi:hypothetical protein